jgi:hypothetical protein
MDAINRTDLTEPVVSITTGAASLERSPAGGGGTAFPIAMPTRNPEAGCS